MNDCDSMSSRQPPTSSEFLKETFILYTHGGIRQHEVGETLRIEMLRLGNILPTDTLEDILGDRCLMAFLKNMSGLGLSDEVRIEGTGIETKKFAVRSVYPKNNPMFLTDLKLFFHEKRELHHVMITNGHKKVSATDLENEYVIKTQLSNLNTRGVKAMVTGWDLPLKIPQTRSLSGNSQLIASQEKLSKRNARQKRFLDTEASEVSSRSLRSSADSIFSSSGSSSSSSESFSGLEGAMNDGRDIKKIVRPRRGRSDESIVSELSMPDVKAMAIDDVPAVVVTLPVKPSLSYLMKHLLRLYPEILGNGILIFGGEATVVSIEILTADKFVYLLERSDVEKCESVYLNGCEIA